MGVSRTWGASLPRDIRLTLMMYNGHLHHGIWCTTNEKLNFQSSKLYISTIILYHESSESRQIEISAISYNYMYVVNLD